MLIHRGFAAARFRIDDSRYSEERHALGEEVTILLLTWIGSRALFLPSDLGRDNVIPVDAVLTLESER